MLVLNRRVLLRTTTILVLLFAFGLRHQTLAHAAPVPPIIEYPLLAGASGPEGIVKGPDGALWFAEQYSDRIGRITLDGKVTEYQLFATAAPIDITVGPDGALWFSEYGPNGKLGRITTDGKITQFSIPTAGARLWGITKGPASDGALWFTEFDKQKIGRITTSGAVTEFPIPTGNAFPSEITLGPDGNLWFSEEAGDKIGRITTSGIITEKDIPNSTSAGLGPCGITAGPDGNVWFALQDGNAIGKISPDMSQITLHATPTTNPIEMTLGLDGNVWVAEGGDLGAQSGKIARVTTDFVFTEYTLPTANTIPYGVTFGPDANVWFTEDRGTQVGTIKIFAPSAFVYLPLLRR